MAETTQSCFSDPNFAVICFYLKKFGSHLALPELNINQLKTSIEDKKSGGNKLRDLHLCLLRRLGRKSVSTDRWEKSVEQFVSSYSYIDGWDLHQYGYWNLKIRVKLSILKNLFEAQFDNNTKFKEKLNEISADDLRQHPLGYDIHGQAYWFLSDNEMNMNVFRGEQDDADGETWQTVSRERGDLVSLIETLRLSVTLRTAAVDDSAKPTVCSRNSSPSCAGDASPARDSVTTAHSAQHSAIKMESKENQCNLESTLVMAVSPVALDQAVSVTTGAQLEAPQPDAAQLDLKHECNIVQSQTEAEFCDQNSDCSSDNVPLSQVRKSCRLLTRARAAIAEVKKKRDKIKVWKKSKHPPKERTTLKEKPRRQKQAIKTDPDASEEISFSEGEDGRSDENSSDDDYMPHGRNAQRAARRKAAADALPGHSGVALQPESVVNDDTPCTRCGEYTHPDLILLCDQCNAGHHTGCLRPPLFFIPDGDWFCPTCEHNMLILKLETALADYDAKMKVKDRALKRQERMTSSGISLENIITTHQDVRPKRERTSKRARHHGEYEYEFDDDNDEGVALSEPSMKRSCRTRGKVSYCFEEYEELIKSAIADSCIGEDDAPPESAIDAEEHSDVNHVRPPVSGKDMSTILAASQVLGPSRVGSRPGVVSRGKDMSSFTGLVDDSDEEDEQDDDESVTSRPRKQQQPSLSASNRKKKPRRLTGLDESGSEDDLSEEYKATDDECMDEDDDMEEEAEVNSCDSDLNSENSSVDSWRHSARKASSRATRSQPARASKQQSHRYTSFVADEDSGSESEPKRSRNKRAAAGRRTTRRVVRLEEPSDDEAVSPASWHSGSSERHSVSSSGGQQKALKNKWNKRTVSPHTAENGMAKRRRRRTVVVESEDESSAKDSSHSPSNENEAKHASPSDDSEHQRGGTCEEEGEEEVAEKQETEKNCNSSQDDASAAASALKSLCPVVEEARTEEKAAPHVNHVNELGGQRFVPRYMSSSEANESCQHATSSASRSPHGHSAEELLPAEPSTSLAAGGSSSGALLSHTAARAVTDSNEGIPNKPREALPPVDGDEPGTSTDLARPAKDDDDACSSDSQRQRARAEESAITSSQAVPAASAEVAAAVSCADEHTAQGASSPASASSEQHKAVVNDKRMPPHAKRIRKSRAKKTIAAADAEKVHPPRAAQVHDPRRGACDSSYHSSIRTAPCDAQAKPFDEHQTMQSGEDMLASQNKRASGMSRPDDLHRTMDEPGGGNNRFASPDRSGIDSGPYMGRQTMYGHTQESAASHSYSSMTSRQPLQPQPTYYGQPMYADYVGVRAGMPYSAGAGGMPYAGYPGRPHHPQQLPLGHPPPAYGGPSLSGYAAAMYAQQRYTAAMDRSSQSGGSDELPGSGRHHRLMAPRLSSDRPAVPHHNASFMIDNILQSPQKVIEENEDELSNILDIVSYVTGAPVGDDRAHKS